MRSERPGDAPPGVRAARGEGEPGAPDGSEPARASAAPSGPLVVVVQGGLEQASAAAQPVADRLRTRFAAFEPMVFLAPQRGGEPTLVPLEAAGSARHSSPSPALAPAASQGAVPGRASPLGPLLREGVARGAAGLAIVAAEAHDGSIDWLGQLLSPVVEDGFDFVSPAYRRHRTDGAINTGIVAPLIRTLYGQALRQPLGTEAALSLSLARRLLADEDWRRRPEEAGSDAWLVAKALSSDARIAQAWLGAWPRPAGEPEEPSQTLARALGLVFTEMERHASVWQRTGPSRPVPTFGTPAHEAGGERLDAARLLESFARGLRDLLPVWTLVLPPATLLALQRAAQGPAEGFALPDGLWARVVFDFAVAHLSRAVERRQLLRSFTPLYMGWLAGLVRAAETLDEPGFEERLESVAAAFEREKRYLIARWRWPDDFNP